MGKYNVKTIKMSPQTHKELGKLIEYKGQTYEQIIQNLLEEHKENKPK